MRRIVMAMLLLVPGPVSRSPALASAASSTELPLVVANDNRTPAGTMRDGVLTLELAVVMARWYPEAANGPHVDLLTFAEVGKAPTIPGPLVRVRRGTRVRMVIRNTRADSSIGVWGMG
ncbi:MAG: hypothetical protein ABMA00_04770, partial [Gemmatimonas sp.]